MRYLPLSWFGPMSVISSRLAGKKPWWYSEAASSLLDSFSSGLSSLGSGIRDTAGYFKDIIGTISNGVKQLLTGDSLENLIKYYSHSGMTNDTKEAMDYSTELQRQLNMEEFERQVDFYQRFQSPQAMVQQYQDAGLNPMLLSGGAGAGASAQGGVGSPQSGPGNGANPLQLIESLVGIQNQIKRVEQDYDINKQRNEIAMYEAQTRRMQAEDYTAYLRSRTDETNVRIEQMKERFPAEISKLNEQTNLLKEQAKTVEGQRALQAAHIDLAKAEEALTLRQAAIAAAQEKYADKYFKLVAEYQNLINDAQSLSNEFARKTLQNRIDAVEYEMDELLFQAAIKAKDFENYSNVQIREWINTGSRAFGALAGVAAVGFTGYKMFGPRPAYGFGPQFSNSAQAGSFYGYPNDPWTGAGWSQ